MRELIIGVDESGTGAWAGPYVVSAVAAFEELLREDVPELNDSKKLSDSKRRRLVPCIQEHAVAHYSAVVDVDSIRTSHRGSWLQGVCESIVKTSQLLNGAENFRVVVDGTKDDRLYSLLRDANVYPGNVVTFRQKADQTHPTVMAASILAKTLRNDLMIDLDNQYPEFLWAKNAGYGTPEHIFACERYGLTEHHRPIRRLRGLPGFTRIKA